MVSAPFSQIIGQTQAIELLIRAVTQKRIAPAYLFVGPEGVGRGLAAASFSELLLGSPVDPGPLNSDENPKQARLRHRIQQRNHSDLLWVEPTYLHQGRRITADEALLLGLKRKSPAKIRLEQVRQIAQFLSRPPLESTRSVVVIQQAETMAEAAANALLKTLEEPGQATLILIAPDSNALLPTLISRCQCISFSRLNSTQMAQVLRQTDNSEILTSPEVLAIAQGSPGQAIASWRQRQAMPPDLLSALNPPPTSLKTALELARSITQTLDTEAQLWLVDYLQQCYWQSGQFSQVNALRRLEEARRHLLSYVQPRLVWEVTLMGLMGGECEIGCPSTVQLI